jgi:hypothetical protein
LWDKILREKLGLAVEEGRKEWRSNPVFVSHPLYAAHVEGAVNLDRALEIAKPIYNKRGIPGVQEAFKPFFDRGFGKAPELLAAVEESLRVDKAVTETREKISRTTE